MVAASTPPAATPPAATPRAGTGTTSPAAVLALVAAFLLAAALLAAAASRPDYAQLLLPAPAVHVARPVVTAAAAAAIAHRRHSHASHARPARHHHKRAPPSGYLMVLSVSEGFSGWLVVLEEAVALAVALNRVLVLPCVRAGKLLPCTPWAPVRGPPALAQAPHAAGAGAAWQALAREAAAGLPAFAFDCPGNGSELLAPGSRSQGDAFSLDAYFSQAGIDAILARGLARLHHVHGVPLPARPRGFYRVRTTTFAEWLSATYPGRRITRPLHFNVAAVDLMTNERCQGEATSNKYFAGGDFVFMGGKLCPQPPKLGDDRVSGIAHDLGFLTRPDWQGQPLLAVVKWQRAQLMDMSAAVPFPQPHAVHFALVRAWLRRHRLSTASLDQLASSPAPLVARSSKRQRRSPARVAPDDGDCCGVSRDGSEGLFTVAQWRTETLGAQRFVECSRLVIDAVRALVRDPPTAGSRCGNATTAAASGGGGSGNRTGSGGQQSRSSGSHNHVCAPRAQPVVLVTDLPSSGSPCTASFNYNHDEARLRSESPLLTLPGTLKYDRDLLDAGIPLLDAGVMSLHEYIISVVGEPLQLLQHARQVGATLAQASAVPHVHVDVRVHCANRQGSCAAGRLDG